MTQQGMGCPGLPPESVFAYIEDMLMELAILAGRNGEAGLCASIETAAIQAGKVNLRRQAAAAADDAA